MKRSTTLLPLLFLFTGCVSARRSAEPVHPDSQTTDVEDIDHIHVSDKISIRRERRDDTRIDKPARIAVYQADHGRADYALDLGVTWNEPLFTLDNTIEFRGSVELHRNTIQSKPQNMLVASIDTSWDQKFGGGEGGTFQPSLAFELRKDRETGIDSVATVLQVGIVTPHFGLGYYTYRSSRKSVFAPRAGVGLEYDQVIANNGPGGHGKLMRANGYFELAWYPTVTWVHDNEGNEWFRYPYTFSIETEIWFDFLESSTLETGEDQHDLIRLGARADLDERKNFGIGFEWQRGEDPTRGLPDQQYWLLGLTAQF